MSRPPSAAALLPATVYLMQGDVINHYRHALDHGGRIQ
jgi:hypothetical protein